ncbi:alpha-ketoglutarate-dependent dioxygenase AlkB family protein [Zooshikella harenae]|uniref:Alpha-ketoglutarate-dependent dioxygenase AlkB n=1 Tax=Zooshikella harenae TaxID=2827238 RepID=A0ABS5ZBZ5_9GAMM|nr:alpha-ketoglutarate-dependent dioxygenase AlkB [Zooshikella harenae]MBU2711403.1 alpha-ketoglutarate-dependent dioxygenase AlkB [Zooshikella harenae]
MAPRFHWLTLPDGEVGYLSQLFNLSEQQAYFQFLMNSVDWQYETLSLFGKQVVVPRKVAWYGDSEAVYAYSGVLHQPLPWTAELTKIKQKVEHVCGEHFNSVLLNLYQNGADYMGWHSDDEPELGDDPVIASVSFGASRDFKLRHKKYRKSQQPVVTQTLISGSCLLMKGATQRYWQHSVPKRSLNKVSEPRVNLTFRLVKLAEI